MRQWRGHSHANAAHSRESGLVLSLDQSCPRLLSLAALAAFYPPPLNFTAAKGEPIHPQTVRDANTSQARARLPFTWLKLGCLGGS
ncbi:uncharacterized protein PGTG_00532 [Puccinia graminis f. sp. tritici CRL 75-36-700-3]|uniref:Uncharacterized protein n=1 Tax=Puccinia graminis f. sp. tritici (strain CRL 75-36-700-3 / race SCCL) TaxID=418459 RepID=E3JRB2_PUCGT|nr:uncharacterized protein PGTG_00532 [Puccinia graminis f. sp. tritici CRL 75-36-700-3]EFP74576.2 hypothetical protein PGTG_00532 [Puccinia graminis f. sp. tritici CRL 75-36-700-3]